MRNPRSLNLPSAPDYVLHRARVPACLLADAPQGVPSDLDDALLIDIRISNGTVAALTPAGQAPSDGIAAVDLAGRHVWPTLVDTHAHLDKAHIIDRTQNPDGDFAGARDATSYDRMRYWRAEDVRRRMDFGLRCAEAHGVTAIRTHLDSHDPQGDISWAVFREMRDLWRGRIELQAAGLMPIDMYAGRYGDHLADLVAESGGIMGGVTRASGAVHGPEMDDLDALIDRVFTLAAERDLDIDLHVDETSDPAATTLWNVAQATLKHGYEGRVTCGHCCSLAVQDDDRVARTIELVAKARINIVTLPTVNMYLQDRVAARTPRWRGVTLVKELRKAGIRVAMAGDNCRDPFYAYGDHDMLDTFRQGVRILHLDHPHGDAPALATNVPASIMGLPQRLIAVEHPADLIILNARSMNELIARPQSDRIILRAGRRQSLELPDYGELNFVTEAKPFPREISAPQSVAAVAAE
ncbi:cytosine deaminase [Pseudorhodoplanes sinuspersici]|uniref:Cytosine deaminase n=1 Tax=Pseudorhodoplanes sinuspersici TaxID=1235591 RepID=A0A1W7A1E8_9HYPH|nr:cytosine deaminase [Pseudorhodoplanes sinuspersici]ARQ03261.1 cytosine deaminase [Pseudorhodoplanes sinuspersici]